MLAGGLRGLSLHTVWPDLKCDHHEKMYLTPQKLIPELLTSRERCYMFKCVHEPSEPKVHESLRPAVGLLPSVTMSMSRLC